MLGPSDAISPDDDVLKTAVSIFPAAPFSVLEFLNADRARTVKTADFAFVKGQRALRVARIGCPAILQLVGEVQAALALARQRNRLGVEQEVSDEAAPARDAERARLRRK